MSTNKASYGPATSVTITIASLAAGAARESAAIDNSATRYLDGLLTVALTLAAGTIGDLSGVNVYVLPSPDGSLWPSPGTGLDSAISLANTPPASGHQVGKIPTLVASQSYTATFRTLLAYDAALTLPPHFSVVLENRSGVVMTTATVSFTGLQTASV